MPGTVTLKVIAGPLKDKVYTFNEHETFIFGRAHNCHARLSPDDNTASRHHFILEVNPPDARIRDLGSRNGTFVNDIKHGGRERHETAEEGAKRSYPEVDIKDGDRIEVGKTVFEVQVEMPEFVGETDFITLPPVLCNLCSRDVTSEVGGMRRGDYVCKSCQGTAESDPAEVLVKELMARGQAERPPVNLDAYEIGPKLGEGGMGAVYLGRRKDDNVPVAIKVMLAKVAVDESSRKRFEQEINIISDLKHPNIVRLYEQGSSGSAFYFVMEFCPGGDVNDLMKERGGRLSVEEGGAIMLQTLDGLAHAHSRGYIHRDIKPQNILLTSKQKGEAKLSDFGLAKNFQMAGLSGMTATGAVAGTLLFMSRDQLINFKYAKPASDVWSMGATLYFMLTGKFTRDFTRAKDTVTEILSKEVVPVRQRDPGIPHEVAEVIDRSISDDVNKRYPSAAEFRDALAGML